MSKLLCNKDFQRFVSKIRGMSAELIEDGYGVSHVATGVIQSGSCSECKENLKGSIGDCLFLEGKTIDSKLADEFETYHLAWFSR